MASHIATLIHLGSKAFTEFGGEVVNVVLMTLVKTQDNKRQGIFADLTGLEDKKVGLYQLCTNLDTSAWRKSWADFNTIPGKPIAYNLDPAIIGLFKHPLLESRAKVPSGMVTGNNNRYVQFWWETGRDKTLYMKGGETVGWYGNNFFCIDASPEGFTRMRASRTFRSAGAQWYGRDGITYSSVSSLIRARYMEPGSIWDCGGPVIIPDSDRDVFWLLALINSTFATYILHSLNPTINIKTNDVKRLPLCEVSCRDDLSNLSRAAIAVAINQDSQAILSMNYLPLYLQDEKAISLTSYLSRRISQKLLYECLLTILQFSIDNIILKSFEMPEHLYSQFQRPAAKLPCVSGYGCKDEIISHIPESIEEITHSLSIYGNLSLQDGELVALKDRLRTLYEVGPKVKIEPNKEVEDISDRERAESEDEKDFTIVKHISFPVETFLEDLAIKLKVHPISVYWLLKEGRERERWQCLAEEKNMILDIFSSMVLQLLGFRWPKETEFDKSISSRVNDDGIILITLGCGKHPLLELMHQRIADVFPGGNVANIESEFEEIVGMSLASWLSDAFFKRHISQFKSRPIAWQIESKPVTGLASKRHKTAKAIGTGPIFSCLVFYHKIDVDLLHKLRTQYVGPLRDQFETELRTLEQTENPTVDQSTRRIQLYNWIEELRVFDKKLEEVAHMGFENNNLAEDLVHEALDEWTSRDGVVTNPTDYESLHILERRYDPDLNNGIRVNIAPLQKAGLLATEVLDKKDIEKAISDRALWRADERRLCREGRLPRPFWWKKDEGQ